MVFPIVMYGCESWTIKKAESEVAQLYPTLSYQAPPSMGFSRQEYWSGLPFPYPGNLPDPGIEPRSFAFQADALSSEPPGKLSTEELMLLNYGVGEDSWESLGLQGDPTSQSQRKSVLNRHCKDWYWTETPILWPPDVKNRLTGKDSDAGKDWGREEKGMTEDEMVGWHHWHNELEFQ